MPNQMRNSLLYGEKQQILNMTESVCKCLISYFHGKEDFNPARIRPTAFTSVVSNPSLPVGVLTNMAKVTLWIFAIDDILDEKKWEVELIDRRLSKYEQIIQGDHVELDVEDSCGLVLKDIVNSIRERPLYPKLRALWESSYRSMIRGMLSENNRCNDLDSFEDYMRLAKYSVGVPLYVISGWILQVDSNCLEYQSELEEMMDLSARCLRLANDLRSHIKERLEGKQNSIRIFESMLISQGIDQVNSYVEAVKVVQQELTSSMKRFLLLCNDEIPLKKSLRRLTQCSVNFYNENDFHNAKHNFTQHILYSEAFHL